MIKVNQVIYLNFLQKAVYVKTIIFWTRFIFNSFLFPSANLFNSGFLIFNTLTSIFTIDFQLLYLNFNL